MKPRKLFLRLFYGVSLWLGAALIGVCCAVIPTPPPIPPPPDPGPSADIEAECVAACERLSKLRCPGHEGSPGEDEVHGTADDVACSQVCFDMESGEPRFPFHGACIAGAESCEAVEACYE